MNEFNKFEKLYHYTSFENALLILTSKKLKFSNIQNVNDINESYRPIYTKDSFEKIDLAAKEIKKYRQISFCKDTPRKGYAIAPMWGHYAQKGNGVCLCFDKNKLLNNHKSNEFKYSSIKYKKSYNPDVVLNSDDVENEIFKQTENIFFKKEKSWSYEQEFRLIKRCGKDEYEYLDIEDSLLCIIIYKYRDIDLYSSQNIVLNSTYHKILEKITNPIYELGQWNGKWNLRDSEGNEIDAENSLMSQIKDGTITLGK